MNGGVLVTINRINPTWTPATIAFHLGLDCFQHEGQSPHAKIELFPHNTSSIGLPAFSVIQASTFCLKPSVTEITKYPSCWKKRENPIPGEGCNFQQSSIFCCKMVNTENTHYLHLLEKEPTLMSNLSPLASWRGPPSWKIKF